MFDEIGRAPEWAEREGKGSAVNQSLFADAACLFVFYLALTNKKIIFTKLYYAEQSRLFFVVLF